VPNFVIYPDAALNKPATPRSVDAKMLAAGEALRAAATEVQAYGLAAAHLGLDEPFVVVSISDDPQQRDYVVMFNPEVLAVADQEELGPEGSVSMPDIQVPVSRPLWAEIAYDDAEGNRQTARYEGFVARVALHEIEQMNGQFFLTRVSRLKRDTAIRKFEKSRRLAG
jgi:peptide deformylase